MAALEYPISFLPRSAPLASESRGLSANGGGADRSVGLSRIRTLPDGSNIAISASGDYAFLTNDVVAQLISLPSALPIDVVADLQSRFFLTSSQAGRGTARLLRSRQEAKRLTVSSGPSLHIIVPTLQCAHSCQYCQVSRSLNDDGHTISALDLDSACDAIFLSPAPTLTVEFQGGDPLLRFDLVERAVRRITLRNEIEGRSIRFVVASTLHQLTAEMCEFFKSHNVFLSTSIDGPAELHNKNRPTPNRDSYQRTLEGIELAREKIGPHAVSALMTTTKASLAHPAEIIDEYVRLGLPEVFLRPLSSYGFAKRNQSRMGYGVDEFMRFYSQALDRVLWWNERGIAIREVYSSIIFNKILSTFDAGYVDLQSPTGAGSSVLVYNYDGYVYPSDEARMLAETGDVSLRIGRISEFSTRYLQSPVLDALRRASEPGGVEGCASCAYHQFCGPNPVDAVAQHGTMFAPVLNTEHCQRHMAMFDAMYLRLKHADEAQREVFYYWARPSMTERICDE